MTFSSLDLAARAELLGLSCREYVALAQSDARIVAYPSLDGPDSVTRLKRWFAAGSPAADFSRLEFGGADEVRAIVVDVLKRAPAPVAWHGVEEVMWIEVGRGAGGWQGFAPRIRPPAGDQAHVIALCGTRDDDWMRYVIAHELGHSWSLVAVPSDFVRVSMSRHELTAGLIAADKFLGYSPDRLIREGIAREVLADDLAHLWGCPGPLDRAQFRAFYLRRFTDQHAAAAPLAVDIEHAVLEKEQAS